jgi:hypothetical protein
MSYYEINRVALTNVNPFVSSHVTSKAQEVLPYEVFMDKEILESLNLVHTQTFQPLYASKPQEIIAAQIERFKSFQEYPYLYFFGMGNGVLLKQLLSNPRHQRIVVIEPEPLIMYIVFHVIDFSKELTSGRLVLLAQEQLNFPTISALFADFWPLRYAKVYDLHVMSAYYEAHASLIQQSNRLFIESLHQTIQTAGNDTKDALIGLKHHITNLPLIPQTPPLRNFLKQAHISDVAVLVSTGPSLSKQLSLLKEIAPYVSIFAVDASLTILIKNGIKPDVVTSIERVPQTSRFFKEIPKKAMEGVITVLSSIQHAEVIDSVMEGDKLISLRPLGYMMLTGPNAWGYAGIGMSSANMAYELIYHSDFKTCILIGQDLAYGNDGKSHASGHLFGENDVKHNEGDGWAVAYGGEGRVRTTAVWNMFRGSFEKDIVETSKRMLTINATEGGARIFGTQELPFAQALSLHVKKNRVKTSIQLSQLALKEQKIILEEVTHNVEEIKNYVMQWQKRVETLFLDVIHTCEALDAKQTVLSATLQALLERIAAVQKARNEEMFDKVIWHIAQSMMLVQDIAIAPIEVVYAPDEKSMYAKMTQLLYAYKSWLFALAGSMDAIVKTVNYSQGRSLIHTVHKVDVWLGNTKIDTITCKDMKAQNGRVFDIEMRGILYDASDSYFTRSSEIIFKKADTEEILPNDFIRVIERTDDSYNEYYFAQNLSNPIDEEKIKVLCNQNNIGFLVTKENLEDQDFVKYIKVLLIKFPTLNFKAFYMTTRQKQSLENIFSTVITKIECIKLLDIYDIPSRVKVFVCSNHTPFDSYLWEMLRLYSNVVMVYHTALSREYTIGSVVDLYKERSHPVFTKPNFFGFEQNELIAKDYSLEKLFYEPFMGSISDDENLYDFLYFKLVSELLTNSELRKFYITFAKNEARYLDLQKKNELSL